jgi:2,4-dienoyl-CoA reductase-like NADH-dependent reductase (Old Yellow Enzyme family)
MPSPFDPIVIDGVELRNRFMRSATWDASATDDGDVTHASVRIFDRLAQGGVGLIVTGYAYVSEQGKAAAGQYGISEDRHIEGLRCVVEAAHDHGARIAVQIAHTGGNILLLKDPKRVALAPSQIEGNPAPHRPFTAAEIEETIADFAAAAARAKEAGFDAIQLHFAHGYLGSQFLSPLTNHRTDEWGGSPEKRRRFHVEVIRAVRKATGNRFPVWAKFGLVEGEGGISLEEGLDALKAMVAEGLSAVEISAGQGAVAVRTERPEDEESPFFVNESTAAKRAVDIPVMVVGGIRSLATAEHIVGSGGADMISMSRPLIREPDLINRWQSGDTTRAKCIRCNKCMAAVFIQGVLACQEEALLREQAAAQQ